MVQRAAPHALHGRRGPRVEPLAERRRQLAHLARRVVHRLLEPERQQPAATTEVLARSRGDKNLIEGLASSLLPRGYCSAGLPSLEPAPSRLPVLAIVTVRAFPWGFPLLACEPVTITRSPIFIVLRVQPFR
jgi:hypothetical protein